MSIDRHISALDFAKSLLVDRRLATHISIDQTRDLARAVIQKDQTINFQQDQINALCIELDALKKPDKRITINVTS